MREDKICETFYNMYKVLWGLGQFGNGAYVFHVANERKTSYAYGAKLRRMGVISGVADYCVLYDGGCVAFIEFKRDAKCKLSDNQSKFKEMCKILKIPYLLTHDCDEAIAFIKTL